MDSMLGPLSAFLSSCTWAIGSATYTNLSKKHPAYVININRALIALPICILIVFLGGGSIANGFQEFSKLTVSNFSWLAISVLASYAFADVLFFWSAIALGVPAALAISAIYPIWSALAGYLVDGQKMGTLQFGGLLAVVGGVVLVILSGRPQSNEKIANRAYLRGVGLALATSVLWSLNTFSVMRGGTGISAMVGNSIRMTLSLALCPLVAFAMRQHGSIKMEKKTYLSVGWIFALEAVGGSTFFMYGLTHSSLAVGSALSSLAPAIAVPISWIMGKEKFSIAKTFGILIIILGIIFLVQR